MMKRLLLCLALLLVPASLMACPPGQGGNACGCGVEIVNVDQEVADVTELIKGVAVSNIEAVNQIGQQAAQLQMEVRMSVEDEEVAGRVVVEFEKAHLLFSLALNTMREGDQQAALASLEDGPAAAELRLTAASKYAKATGYLLRCGAQLTRVVALAEAALGSIEEEVEEGPTAELLPTETRDEV